jgi:hypothetical protein
VPGSEQLMGAQTQEQMAQDLAAGKAFKRFIVQRETWYYADQLSDKDVVAELGVGIDSTDGGTYGEWTIAWRRLGHNTLTKVAVYDDAWTAFMVSEFAQILQRVGEGVTVDQMVEELTAAGWRDATERQGPRRETAQTEARTAARDALTTAALQRIFADEEGAFDEFSANHKRLSLDWLNDCPDNLCRHARKQANDVLAVLDGAGYKVVASNG